MYVRLKLRQVSPYSMILGYLHCALQYMEAVGAPTQEIVGILSRIRESHPRMQRIWGRNPARNPERASLYAQDLELETELLQKV